MSCLITTTMLYCNIFISQVFLLVQLPDLSKNREIASINIIRHSAVHMKHIFESSFNQLIYEVETKPSISVKVTEVQKYINWMDVMQQSKLATHNTTEQEYNICKPADENYDFVRLPLAKIKYTK